MAPATSTLRKYWRPALATGTGSTSILIWFEEILALWLDILSLLALLLVTTPILLFNQIIFKSAVPRKEDGSSPARLEKPEESVLKLPLLRVSDVL